MKKKNRKLGKPEKPTVAATAAVETSEVSEPIGDTEAAALRKELADARDALLRARAEVQNVVKRSANERTEAVRYANASLVKSLLGTLDDFERTLEHCDSADAEALVKGVKLIYDGFLKVLRDHRVEVIDALGHPFDPRFHEALQQQFVEGTAPGTVVAVLATGYRLDDRVLRPAKVVIAAEPQAVEAGAKSSEAAEATGRDGDEE